MSASFSPQLLRAARERAGISREQLAVDAGWSFWSVVAYERGQNRPPVNVAAKLAELLGCSMDDFMVDDDRPVAS